MIPKIIHYCWFGRNSLPVSAKKCIASWRKYFPGYEIKEWNEDNFDVNIIPYTKEAYQAKKFAFVSDYARFWILYKYGGLYFDTDVEVIKPMDDIIERGSFMGCERDGIINGEFPTVAPGLVLGVMPNIGLYKKIIESYATLHFIKPDGTYNQKTVVSYTTEILCQYGLKNTNKIQIVADVWIYPKEYFCPLDSSLAMKITENTRSIHHFDSTWLPLHKQFIKRIKKFLGYSFSTKLRNFMMILHVIKK